MTRIMNSGRKIDKDKKGRIAQEKKEFKNRKQDGDKIIKPGKEKQGEQDHVRKDQIKKSQAKSDSKIDNQRKSIKNKQGSKAEALKYKSQKNQNHINQNHLNQSQKNQGQEKSKHLNGNKEKQLKKMSSGKSFPALCSVSSKCGCCQLLDMNYEQQLKMKQKKVEGLLGKFAKVEPIIGMDNPYHYRNKVHAVFDRDRYGNPISGVYEPGTHRVIPVDKCLIEDEQADAIIVTIRGMLKSFKIKTYDEDTGYGLLRHVLIRKGFHSGQIMVVLVLSSPILPSKNNFVKALLKVHPEITTIVINVNDKHTSMILGDKEQVIYGKGYIEDTLCGKVFRISPKSFYQVNTVQTEVLYNKAIKLAGLTGAETVIDAYCGIGTISLIAADHSGKVIGVELNPDAVRDARTNAKRNNISNVDFYNKDAGEFMVQIASQGEKVDVVFMDPPRAGSDEKFLNSVCTLSPAKVVYISCNPETLERDLKYLVKKKYKVERVIPVDMFPGTEHVETICLMSKK